MPGSVTPCLTKTLCLKVVQRSIPIITTPGLSQALMASIQDLSNLAPEMTSPLHRISPKVTSPLRKTPQETALPRTPP